MSERDAKNQEIRDRLSQVVDPGSGKDLVSLGAVSGVTHCEGAVKVTLQSVSAAPPVRKAVEEAVRGAVSSLGWVENVELKFLEPGEAAPEGEGAPAAGPRYIAVGSGKGGVGKSTVAVNLAVGLAKKGLKVGLLDADIYGPSIPTMLGTNERPQVVDRDGKKMMVPVTAHGLQLMSIGFMVEGDKPLILRGPMLHGALRQFFNDVAWDGVDVLVIDLPPGTGDVALTMAQTIALTGAIIVSTPQEVAMADARKAYNMFDETKVPVLGIVENMTGPIFGEGGAANWAESVGVPCLGSLPLDASVRKSGDAGRPAVLDDQGAIAAFVDRTHALLEEKAGPARKPISIRRAP